MTYCMYYCFHCDLPADEHREGSCRNCGKLVTRLVESKEEAVTIIKRETSSE